MRNHSTKPLLIATALALLPWHSAGNASNSAAEQLSMVQTLLARKAANQLELRRAALELMTLADESQQLTVGLSLPPAGLTDAQGKNLHPRGNSLGLFHLPAAMGQRTDTYGNRLAYCAFDPRPGTQNNSPGRVGSTAGAQPGHVAVALISAGNNGRFDTACSTLQTLNSLNPSDRFANTPTSSTAFNDDEIVLLSHADLTVNGRQQMALGPSVQTWTDLPSTTDTAPDRQVRWVRSTQQFAVSQVVNNKVSWRALNPETQIDALGRTAWTSGGIAMGSADWGGATVRGTRRTSALTLGNDILLGDASVAENPDAMVGIALTDSSATRAYLGLSGDKQDSFVLRHTASTPLPVTRDRLRITPDGRLWLGEVPATDTAPADSRLILQGGVQVIQKDTESEPTYLHITRPDELTGLRRSAGLRTFSGAGNFGLDIRLLQHDATGNTLINTGDIVFNTLGRVGIAHAAGTPLQAKLDVNGNARLRGALSATSVLTLRGNTGAQPVLSIRHGSAQPHVAMGLEKIDSGPQFFMRVGDNPAALTLSADAMTVRAATTNKLLVTIGPNPNTSQPLLVVNGDAQFRQGVRLRSDLTVSNPASPTLTTVDALSANVATFTGAVTANDGITITVGPVTAKAGVDVSGGLTQANAGLISTTGQIIGLTTIDGGLRIDNAALQANAGATIAGPLSAGQGMSVRGDSVFERNLRIGGNLTVDGTLQVAGGIRWKDDITLNAFGYTSGASNTAPTGSVNFNLDGKTRTLELTQANTALLDINQALGRSAQPVFRGLSVQSGGVGVKGNFTGTGGFSGRLQGTADTAKRIANKRIYIRLFKNMADLNAGLPYAIQALDLGSEEKNLSAAFVVHSDTIENEHPSGLVDPTYNIPVDSRSVTLSYQPAEPAVTQVCKRDGASVAEVNCVTGTFRDFHFVVTLDSDTFKTPNTTIKESSITAGAVSTQKTQVDPITLMQPVTAVPASPPPARLIISSDFIDSTANPDTPLTLTRDRDNVATLQLRAEYARANRLDQAIQSTSTVSFRKVTSETLNVAGTLSARSLTLSGEAALTTPLLTVFNPVDGQAVMVMDGDTERVRIGEIVMDGRGGIIRANRLRGTADLADGLTDPLTFQFTGVLTSTQSSNPQNTRYVVNTTFQNSSIEGRHWLAGTVGSSQLAVGAIGSAAVADNAITSEKLATRSLPTRVLADGSITADRLAVGAVQTRHLQDSLATTQHFANRVVNTSKLANDSVTLDKLHEDLLQALSISSSDQRLKTDINTVAGSVLLDRLSHLRLYGYRFTDDTTGKRTLGVLAQEVMALFPEAVRVQTSGQHEGYFAVNHNTLSAIAITGAGAMKQQIDALGLSRQNSSTLRARLPRFEVTDLQGDKAEVRHTEVRQLDTQRARLDTLDAQQLKADEVRSGLWQSDTLNTGRAEGFGSGAGLALFSVQQDGHYLVQISSPDGSYLSAWVMVSNGQAQVARMNGVGISLSESMGQLMAIGPGKLLKATWLRTA